MTKQEESKSKGVMMERREFEEMKDLMETNLITLQLMTQVAQHKLDCRPSLPFIQMNCACGRIDRITNHLKEFNIRAKVIIQNYVDAVHNLDGSGSDPDLDSAPKDGDDLPPNLH